jgi:LysR family glycine cleavage system transcriptional activator
MPRLPRFLSAHPGVAVEIMSRSAPFDLQEEKVDLAIHYGQPIWANAACTYLCSEVILPVAAPVLIRGGEVQAPGDLAAQPLLHLTTRPKLWAEWFRLGGAGDENAYRGSRFDQFSTIIEAALGGLGVALLPSYLIEAELASGSLEIVFNQPLTTENSYYVVLPDGKREGSLGQEFQEWLIRQVGGAQTIARAATP